MPIASFELDQLDGVAVWQVTGEIDASNVGPLGARMRGGLAYAPLGLALDLRDTTYIDSAGVGLLFEIAARLRAERKALHIVLAPDSFVARVLHAVALENAAAPAADVGEAVAAIRAAG